MKGLGGAHKRTLVPSTRNHRLGVVDKVDVHAGVADRGQLGTAVNVADVLGAPDVGGWDRELHLLARVLEELEAVLPDGLWVERVEPGEEDGALEERRLLGLFLGLPHQQRGHDAGRETLACDEGELALLADELLELLVKLPEAGGISAVVEGEVMVLLEVQRRGV